jgi:tetratricopeptide (TPR) repeat protein
LEQKEKMIDDLSMALIIDEDKNNSILGLNAQITLSTNYLESVKLIATLLILEPKIDSYFITIELFWQAYYYHKISNIEEAINKLNRSINISPHFTSSVLLKAIILIEVKEHKKVLEDLNSLILINPNDTKIFFIRGSIHAFLKNYEDAVDDFNQSLCLNPSFSDSFYQRGLVQYELKDFKKSIDDFTEVIAIGFNLFQAYYYRAKSFYQLNELNSSLLDFNKAISFYSSDVDNPRLASVYLDRGILFYLLDRQLEAFNDFEKAIEQDQSSPLAYFMRGMIYKISNERKKALDDFIKVLQFNLDLQIDDSIILNFKRKFGVKDLRETTCLFIGYIYIELGEFDRALELSSTILKDFPDDVNLIIIRGLALLKKGILNQGKEDFVKGNILRLQRFLWDKSYDMIIESCKIILNIDPDNYEAYFYLSAAYGEQGDYKASIESLQKAETLFKK